jgi:hypothetical protein
MELPTKEERHEIYIRAKEIYTIYTEVAPNIGMCVSIIKVWKGTPAFVDLSLGEIPSYQYLVNEIFPELSKIKPKKKYLKDDHYWWLMNDVKTRIKKFDIIIKMTE